MNIAVLAWGSLVWKPRNRHGSLCTEEAPWSPDGPRLPIEFARISSDGRLTLVVVPGQRTSPVLWKRSCHGELDAAIDNLAARETGAPRRHIHAADHQGALHGESDPDTAGRVATWVARRSDIDAAVWTGLPPGNRWSDHGFEGFSPDAALAYAGTLQGIERRRALEYVRHTPRQVATPLRPRLAEALAT